MPFDRFAEVVIRRRLITALRRAKSQRHEVLTLAGRATREDEQLVPLLDDRRDPDPARMVELRQEIGRRIREDLSEVERDALRHVVNGGDYAGDKRIDNAVQRARVKLPAA